MAITENTVVEFVVWSKDNCVYCQQAANLLLLKKKNFKILKLDVDYAMEDFRYNFPEWMSFPAVVYNGKHIGGFDELREFLK